MNFNINHRRYLFPVLALSLGLPLSACVESGPVYEAPPPVVEAPGPVVTVSEPPPALPVYAQPECPGPGYLWTPGYWAYAPAGYYWVPGTWVMPPRPAVLWTPGYWGWGGGVYLFHAGYWGPHVGFYGGVNYGFGYGGAGYEGGRWNNGVFNYNTAVNNVNVTNIHNTYNTTVINNVTVNRVSYNGGSGGIAAQPTPQEQAALHEQHFQPTAQQMQHQSAASNNRALFASENHGAPAIAATPRPGAFNDHAVVPARAAEEGRPGGGEAANAAPHPEGQAHQSQAEEEHPGSSQPNHEQANREQDRAAPAQSHPQQHNQQPHPQHNQQAHRSAPPQHPHPRPQRQPQHER